MAIYGSVFKLAGNRRNKYGVRITIGWTPDGKQIRRSLGYYKTYREANAALTAYNNDPYDVDAHSITFAEVYHRWIAEKEGNIADSNMRGYVASFKSCPELHRKKFRAIKTEHLREAVNRRDGSASRKKMKVMLTQMYAWAMSRDLVSKDYSQYVAATGGSVTAPRVVFTDDEISTLFLKAPENSFYKLVLILLYSGMRVKEFLIMQKDDVHLESGFMQGGVKTAAGMNRIIPLHDKIKPFIAELMETEGKALIVSERGKPMTYSNFYKLWQKHMSDFEHRIHDTRHTTVSMLHAAGVSPTTIKRIVGHANKNITEHYTHIHLNDLLEAINRI